MVSIGVILLGGIVVLGMVGVAVAVGAIDRRVAVLALSGLAVLLGVGGMLAYVSHMGPDTRLFGALICSLFLPVGLALFLLTAWAWTRRRPAGRDRGLPAPVLRPVGPHQCPDCGADLPANAPEGLCPRCLLGSGLAGPSPTPPPAGPRGTTPYPGPFAAPELAELVPHFPHLEVLELIGQGGMGAVYKARQTKLDRLVALKVLPPEWGSDPAFAERFAREARTLARLNHPHIVAVHDFGESGGLYYLVMEFVDGLNLREALQAGPLPPEQALAVIPQLCDALQYAHEEGVVHRDIKPENILLDKRGRVKIADFGLAKLLNRPRADFTLTGSRQVMGTLDYMAPEQRSRPLEIDHRADIYSLGVVFYEMLTGELPLGRFAPPSRKAGVDARLDEVVFRALETDPAQRYQSVREVKTSVESIARGRAPAAGRLRGPQGGRGVVLATALQQIRGPATGLLLSGVLAPLSWLLIILVWAIRSYPMWTTYSDWRSNPLDVVLREGRYSRLEPLLVLFFLNLVLGGIVVAGARKMRRCEAYELAYMASILALLAFGPAVVLSVPMGIWSLVILHNRRVKAGFALSLRRRPEEGPAPGAGPALRPTGPVRGRVRSFLDSMLAMFVSRPGKGYPVEEDRLTERS